MDWRGSLEQKNGVKRKRANPRGEDGDVEVSLLLICQKREVPAATKQNHRYALNQRDAGYEHKERKQSSQQWG